MNKLEQVKEYLLERRNEKLYKRIANEMEEGDFDSYDSSGGNSDDAFSLGADWGEAALVENLLGQFFVI